MLIESPLSETAIAAGSRCSQCSAELPSGASFCGVCGGAASSRELLPEPISTEGHDALPPLLGETLTEPLRPEPPRATAHRWRGLRRGVLVLTALALAAGLTVLGVNDLQTHHRLHHTQLDLAATQSSLWLVRNDLSDVRSKLINSQTQLGVTLTSLRASEKKLAADEQELQGLRNSLSDAKGRVTVQSGQIETLKSCLNGVSIALVDAANLDYASALAALDAVQVSCDAAKKIVG